MFALPARKSLFRSYFDDVNHVMFGRGPRTTPPSRCDLNPRQKLRANLEKSRSLLEQAQIGKRFNLGQFGCRSIRRGGFRLSFFFLPLSTSLALFPLASIGQFVYPHPTPPSSPVRHLLFYFSQGTDNAPPILLIHGFGASVGHFRKNIPTLVGEGYRVYAIDLLGFGASDKPTDVEVRSNRRRAWSVEAPRYIPSFGFSFGFTFFKLNDLAQARLTVGPSKYGGDAESVGRAP